MPAGHDQFPAELVKQVLGNERAASLEQTKCCLGGALNMTYLALIGSHYINGVAMQHGEVSRGMFPSYPIRAITNGVHAVTWTTLSFQKLYDHHIPEWRHDNLYLRYAIGIPSAEIRDAHTSAKGELLAHVQARTGIQLDPQVMTIGFARRAATYKRADLLFASPERLKWIAKNVGRCKSSMAAKPIHKTKEGRPLYGASFRLPTCSRTSSK